jgi:hypothetical protein
VSRGPICPWKRDCVGTLISSGVVMDLPPAAVMDALMALSKSGLLCRRHFRELVTA